MKKLLTVTLTSALLAAPMMASAHGRCSADDLNHCAYWHDSAGVYATDSNGRCIRTSSWAPGTQVEGCDEIIKPMVAAAPAPKDSDGDGVTDAKDQCPNTPRGAKVDASGCPLDSDRDGVADHRDQCPGTPAGAAVDAKGCELQQFKTVSVNLNVQFANNSADVTSAYATQMEALAYVLKADSNAMVTINGHTDSAGAADYNQQLSQRRAEAVAQHLVNDYGVPAGQVKAVGHGEAMPIADNSTREGRAKNRRVEAEVSGRVQQ